MEKDHRYAASAIIFNEQGKVLIAKRTPTKHPFPNTWSLPSTYLGQGDYSHIKLPAAVRRKLGICIGLEGMLGEKTGEQADYILTMKDYVAKILEGELEPNGEDFTEARYVDFLKEFGNRDRKKMGFCTQILLEALEKNPRLWERYTLKSA